MELTMQELKTQACEFFNSLIIEETAQEYFADAFDLWQDAPALYNIDNNAYKAVIRRFVPPIKEELKRIKTAITDAPTRFNTVTVKGNNEINDSRTLIATTSDKNVSKSADDGHTQTAYAYPQGITNNAEATVTPYLSAQTVDSPDNTDTVSTSEQTNDTTEKKRGVGIHTESTTTSENDELARISILEFSPRLGLLIEYCVFALVKKVICNGDNI